MSRVSVMYIVDFLLGEFRSEFFLVGFFSNLKKLGKKLIKILIFTRKYYKESQSFPFSTETLTFSKSCHAIHFPPKIPTKPPTKPWKKSIKYFYLFKFFSYKFIRIKRKRHYCELCFIKFEFNLLLELQGSFI
jgi:hypothetical protein